MSTTPLPHRRDDAPPSFDPKNYYTLSNPTQPDLSLSAGTNQDSNGAISMTPFSKRTSENWQIFTQSGRYFIRNFDYGSKSQLGATKDALDKPKLLPSDGTVGQQWTIVKVEGGWQLSNGLWRNSTALALGTGWTSPGSLASGEGGGVWGIDINIR
jgi:hypothetical protein